MNSMEFFIASCLAPWMSIALLNHILRKKIECHPLHHNKMWTLSFIAILPLLYFSIELLQSSPVLIKFVLFGEFILLNWLASLAAHPTIKYFRGRSLILTQPVLNLFAIAMILYLSPRFTHASWVWISIFGYITYRLFQALNYRNDYDLMRQKIMSSQSERLNNEIIDFVSRQKSSLKKVS